ncbi:MerR family transcriptional regulator [Sporosarcina cascadiensis]|uniref:helix-turn-helix domain-containing protein n=1 Tax=Sporosarcina cascadiensis TaxID=2660747 RepID=UPI0018910258|nr:helix-turn-helix domain-containing protein [Sporosarcina cascadiensis]
MMIMLTTFEKKEFVKRTPELTRRIFENEDDSLLFFKVLVNYLEKTNINNLQLSKLDESILGRPEEMKKYLLETLEIMAEIAAEDTNFATVYTTGQIAKYFGVSITTINNWIKEGRFVGVERTEKNSQARISAKTLWKSRTGKMYTVGNIVKEWEEEQEENLNDSDELLFLVEQITLYERKYGGNFESTLDSMDDLSSQEQTDAAAWLYFIRKFDELNVNRNSKD